MLSSLSSVYQLHAVKNPRISAIAGESVKAQLIPGSPQPFKPQVTPTAVAGETVKAELLPGNPKPLTPIVQSDSKPLAADAEVLGKMPENVANYIGNMRRLMEEIKKLRSDSPTADVSQQTKELQKNVMALQNWFATHIPQMQHPSEVGFTQDSLKDMRKLLSASVQFLTKEFRNLHATGPKDNLVPTGVKVTNITIANSDVNLEPPVLYAPKDAPLKTLSVYKSVAVEAKLAEIVNAGDQKPIDLLG
jgi:hypothetical protein